MRPASSSASVSIAISRLPTAPNSTASARTRASSSPILAERGFDPGDCVMRGDRKHDVVGANQHGIPTIGAFWGYGGERELREAGAAALCASPAEVPPAFRRFLRAAKAERRRMTRSRSSRAPAPPRAEIRPSQLSAHGLTWADDYAWTESILGPSTCRRVPSRARDDRKRAVS